MYFYVTVVTEGSGTYYLAVYEQDMYWAEQKAIKYLQEEGELIEYAEAVEFDTFEHGDPSDYEILS